MARRGTAVLGAALLLALLTNELLGARRSGRVVRWDEDGDLGLSGGAELGLSALPAAKLDAFLAERALWPYATWPCVAGCQEGAASVEDDLYAFATRVLPHVIARKKPAAATKSNMRAALAKEDWPDAGARRFPVARSAYENLKVALWRATRDPVFVEAHRREEPMLWLEFGVYRGTSVNLTDASRAVRKSNSRRRHLFDGVYGQYARLTGPFLIRLRAAGNFQARVVGFDTFQGLPENETGWKQGEYNWQKEYGSATPPLRAAVELVVGFFNATLGPFLRAAPRAKVAWVNVDNDCTDLCGHHVVPVHARRPGKGTVVDFHAVYKGALDVLNLLAPRFVVGTRIHFHELFKVIENPDDKTAAACPRRQINHRPKVGPLPVCPDQEMRALHDFLRGHPCLGLALDHVAEEPYKQPVVFVVTRTAC